MNHEALILYSFRRCPYAIRARMALAYAKVSYTLREVDLKAKPADLLNLSPKGTVPVLYLGSSKVLDESLDIIIWASEQTAEPIHSDFLATPWLLRLHDEYIPNFNFIKHDFALRMADTNVEHALAKISIFLNDLEKLCAAATKQPFVCPWSNIALFPSIRQLWILDAFKDFRAQFTHITAWVESVIGSTSFQSLMTKHVPWSPELDNAVYIQNAV